MFEREFVAEMEKHKKNYIEHSLFCSLQLKNYVVYYDLMQLHHPLYYINGDRILLSLYHSSMSLFTSQFCVKASQANGESLKCRKGISIVHSKDVLPNLAKLKNNLVMIRLRWL